MKIPKKIDVAGYRYTVHIVDDITKLGDHSQDGRFVGRCYHRSPRRIAILDEAIENKWDILLHEVLHAIAYRYEFGWLDEEERITVLAHALYDILKRNALIDMEE